jgi:hypothetical protein
LTWDYFEVSIWSSVEITVGIICACMPTIRQALTKIFPGIMRGSSAKQYYGGTGSKGISRARKSRLNDTSDGYESAGVSTKQTSVPHTFEGPTAGSASVVVEGGKGAAKPRSNNTGMGGIVVYSERSVHLGDGEGDDFEGDRESRTSDRGDEATLVRMKYLSPRSAK